MKYIYRFYFLFLLFFISHSIKSHINQDLVNIMLRPIECSHKGIKDFFVTTYNNSAYKDFLPACLIHILDLVEHAHANCNDINFLQQIFVVFTQKLKESQWVNPYALIYFLERIQPYLIDMYMSEKNISYEQSENFLLNAIEKDKELIYKDPAGFVKKYNSNLVNLISENSCSTYNAKYSFVNLLDHLCDRVVFDHMEGLDAWSCFLHLLSALEVLYNSSLLYDEISYQRILWALCTRFNYCIELHHQNISDQMYEKILLDLESAIIPSFEIAEIEPLIFAKREWLILKIHEHKSKKLVYKKAV